MKMNFDTPRNFFMVMIWIVLFSCNWKRGFHLNFDDNKGKETTTQPLRSVLHFSMVPRE